MSILHVGVVIEVYRQASKGNAVIGLNPERVQSWVYFKRSIANKFFQRNPCLGLKSLICLNYAVVDWLSCVISDDIGYEESFLHRLEESAVLLLALTQCLFSLFALGDVTGIREYTDDLPGRVIAGLVDGFEPSCFAVMGQQ